MADVSYERTRALARAEAAVWLNALAEGFAHGGEVTLSVGGGGTISLRIPDHVQAEFEVEVEGDEVEVELEFRWSLKAAEAGTGHDSGGTGDSVDIGGDDED